MAEAKINEIFDSIQGEGLYIGCRQVFVRFCGCNLLCDYCDTDFQGGEVYSAQELAKKVSDFPLKAVHSVSLTGGEPLLQYEFLKEFLPLVDAKIYLETSLIQHMWGTKSSCRAGGNFFVRPVRYGFPCIFVTYYL